MGKQNIDSILNATEDLQINDISVLSNIAPAYNTGTTYNVGDLCIYQGQLWICTTMTGSVFNPLYWNVIDVETLFKNLPTPMVFKGTVGTGGTVSWSNLPAASAANLGFTYKVIEDHNTTPICKVGDMIVSNSTEWIVIPAGDEPSGTVTNISVGTGLTGNPNPITTTGTISVDHSIVAFQSDLPSGEIDVTFNGTATSDTQSLTNIVVGTQTYTIDGTVQSVNNILPDSSGNVTVPIPTVNDGSLNIQGNGTTASTFTANSSSNVTLNIKGSGATSVSKTADNEITISSTDNDHYPTTFAWTNGTSSGPTGTLSGNSGFSSVSIGAIPTANQYHSGVVSNTGDQYFAGSKFFTNNLYIGENILSKGDGSTLYLLEDFGMTRRTGAISGFYAESAQWNRFYGLVGNNEYKCTCNYNGYNDSKMTEVSDTGVFIAANQYSKTEGYSWYLGQMFNADFVSGAYFPTADLSTRPVQIDIWKLDGTKIDYTDTNYLIINGWRFNGTQETSNYSGKLKSYQLWILTGPDPTDSSSWVKTFERTNVADVIGGLAIPLWSSLPGDSAQYKEFYGIRLVINDAEGNSTNPWICITEIKLMENRPAGKPSDGVGALSLMGGNIMGDLTISSKRGTGQYTYFNIMPSDADNQSSIGSSSKPFKNIYANTLMARTSSSSSNYGAGNSGQVLKSNGTYAYWGNDNSDVSSQAIGGNYKWKNQMAGYQIFIASSDNKLVPMVSGASGTATTGTSKTMNTESFNPLGLIGWTSSSSYRAADALCSSSTYVAYGGIDIRYSFNCGSTLTANEPVYIVAQVQSDGFTAKLASPYYAQTLPNTADGLIYIYLGQATNTTSINLQEVHPIYQYINGNLREWNPVNQAVQDVQINGTSIVSSQVANFNTKTAYNASTNKIVTESDIPSGELDVTFNGTTTGTEEALSTIVVGTKTYTISGGGSGDNQTVQTSLVSFSDDAAITLTEGSNITITGNSSDDTITIASFAPQVKRYL